MDFLPVPIAAAKAGRIAHDVGLAGLLGGNLYGRLALHPAVAEISDPGERGKVVNAAWRSYGTVNALSLAVVGAGWIGARNTDIAPSRLSGPERRLAAAGDVVLGAVAVTGLATAVQGMRFAKSAPDGAVPLTDGDTASSDATERQARAKKRLNLLGLATLATETVLVGVNAAMDQESFRRPPLKRFARRPQSQVQRLLPT
ncbi:MAG: hypothetical protein QOF76_2106 [Solirubrobacteraceae bacterium]|nr:hypothetical protein [Solirubrobacteraceae bacterium]